jgi:Delta3-Delta2-enoyl-CoA isomerase
MIELEKKGDVFVLRMVDGENRFNARFIARLNQALDEVEHSKGPAALVTTGEGKFYSNGFDLEWMLPLAKEPYLQNIVDVHATMVRMLTFPVMTVAAINGHVFAAGAIVALAHDFRIMRSDRGFFCFPEVDIKLPFTKPMDALIRAKLSQVTAHEAMCTAKRYAATEAVERQIIHLAALEAEVLPKAIELAQSLSGKDRKTLTTIKRRMVEDVIEVFATDIPEDNRESR